MRWRQQWPRLAARRMDSPSSSSPSLLPNTSSQPRAQCPDSEAQAGAGSGRSGSPGSEVGVGGPVPTGHLHDTALPKPGPASGNHL